MNQTFYIDTSVAGRILLGQSPAAARWFDDASLDAGLLTSRLTKTELTRLARRESIDFTERDKILDVLAFVPLDHAVAQEAEAIVPHVRTLDAIHLASALRAGIDGIVIVSHDSRMLEVATEIGFATFDPCSSDDES